jgi:hypothetical protein
VVGGVNLQSVYIYTRRPKRALFEFAHEVRRAGDNTLGASLGVMNNMAFMTSTTTPYSNAVKVVAQRGVWTDLALIQKSGGGNFPTSGHPPPPPG